MHDARISTGLPWHPKTKKLLRRLGPAGPWSLICLFLWAAANRSDGDLSGLSDEDIEIASEWTGEPGQFVAALADVRFVDGEPGAYEVHDWAEHNPWAAGAQMRASKARWNAAKRHHGQRAADQLVPEYAAMRNATSTASSTSAAMLEHGLSNAPLPSPTPYPLEAKSKALVQPAAAQSRFGDFWAAYPNKKGRKDAERHWKREGCDVVADQIIGHVRMMMASDDGWRRGFVPMGSTYVNGRRWEDRPSGPPRAQSQGPSKTMQAIINLEAMKSDGLATARDHNGFTEAAFPVAGPDPGYGRLAWDGGDVDGGFDLEPGMG